MTPEETISLRHASIRVFFGEHALGNLATCFIFEASPGAEWKSRNAAAKNETWCLLWPEAEVVQVLVLKHGREIRFCGHGLVAAGYFWLLTYGETPTLENQGHRYATCSQNDGHFAIAVPRQAALAAIKNEFFTVVCDQHWFDLSPRICFPVGDDDDYLLCVWPHGVNIANLNVNSVSIGMQRRAVIMTQCDALTDTLQDVQPFDLRYIAPQYGEHEGSATGSAAAIAADYWGLHFKAVEGQCFVAHQRSLAGGEIYCELGKRRSQSTGIDETMGVSEIWIGGRVMPSINS